MKKKQKVLEFGELAWEEVCEALIKMLENLHIAGSTADYDLYEAVYKQYKKAGKALSK